MFQGKLEYNGDCPFCTQTVYEFDTGYSEYGCALGALDPEEHPCQEDICPLSCKWQAEE